MPDRDESAFAFGPDRTEALDAAVREMMATACNLPVPARLVAFAESLGGGISDDAAPTSERAEFDGADLRPTELKGDAGRD